MKETVRALLIDDDQGDYVFTKALLSKIVCPKIELDWVPTFEEGHDAIVHGGYDIYLVDYLLGDRTGLDLLREATRHQLQAPVIMLTGRGSHDVDIEAGCRAGNCGTCLVAIKSGEVEYLTNHGADVEEGSCLTCICKPKADLVLDA